jgi:hypothetical protein
MKRKFSGWLAALAAATMGTLLDASCTTGDPPDKGNNCWFICKAIEEPQANSLSDASLSFVHQPAASPPTATS